MERFSPETLGLLRRTAEVEIETRLAAGRPVHRTVIWVVVDDRDHVLIRSYLGAKARWYREALAQKVASILVGDRRVDVRVEPAADEARVEACSRVLREKYPGRRSTEEMLRPEILDTTLEVFPSKRAAQRASFELRSADMGLKSGMNLDDVEALLDEVEGPLRR